MYNESIKRRFIQSYSKSENTEKLLNVLFTNLSIKEAKFSKEFATMKDDELKETITDVSGYRSYSIETVYVLLREYVKWYIREGYDGADMSIDHVKPDSVRKFKEHMVGSPQHLLNSLDIAFCDTDINQTQFIYRTFLWLAFMGFEDTEAIRVRCSNVDLARMEIVMNGETNYNTYEIYKQSLLDIRQAMFMTTIRETKRYTVDRQRAPGDLLLRCKADGKPLNEALLSTFRPSITRAFSDALSRYKDDEKPAGLDLSYKRIYLSGIFYRTYEDERIGISPNFSKQAAIDYENRKSNYTLSGNRTPSAIMNLSRRNYENDYLLWKAAFTV